MRLDLCCKGQQSPFENKSYIRREFQTIHNKNIAQKTDPRLQATPILISLWLIISVGWDKVGD